MRAIALAGRLVPVSLLLTAGAASADPRFGMNVGVSGGFASNPLGSGASGTSAGTLTGFANPIVTIDGPTGSVSLSGEVSHTEYSRLYDGSTDFAATLSTSQQISNLTSLTGGVGFRSQFRDALDSIIDPLNELPLDPDVPIVVDPSAAETYGQRSETLFANVGLTTALSPRDSLSFSGRASRASYPNSAFASQSYDNYGGGVSYLRAISANTSIGLSVDAFWSDYRHSAFGDGSRISPAAILQTRLAPRVALSVSLGVTLSDTELAVGSVKDTSLYANASLCHRGERSTLCASGSRSVAPSSITGTSLVTAAGVSYNYRIDSRSTLSAGVSYSSARSLLTGFAGQDVDYGHANLGYSRQLTQRLSAFVSAGYSDSFDSLIVRNANYSGSVGIRYRLGDL